jgi:hypothetical protein
MSEFCDNINKKWSKYVQRGNAMVYERTAPKTIQLKGDRNVKESIVLDDNSNNGVHNLRKRTIESVRKWYL